MLPKQHRLTRSQDFARVRRRGRSSGSPLLALYVLPVRSSPDVRIGFSVSKKVGKAVIRNRVKRRMREVVRRRIPEIRPGQDLVFIARPASATATYDELNDTIHALLRKTGAIRQPLKV